jgi:hypothetical protein
MVRHTLLKDKRMPSDQELFDSLLEKIYGIVTGPDPINKTGAIGGSFVSFCLPGIPLAAEDLDFNFVDMLKSEAAADFASLVNGVPPPRGRWSPSDRKIDSYYHRVLEETIRPTVVLSDAEKARLLAAQAVLIRDVEAVDLTTGGSKKVPADTPLYEAYQERMSEYLNALSAFKSVQQTFLALPNDPAAQAAWFTKGQILQQQVKLKYGRWLAGGKTIIEQALQTIEDLGRGSGERWDRMRTILRDSDHITSEGAHYLFTKFFPAKFWDDAHTASWTKFRMTHEEIHTVDSRSSANWGGGGSASFGLWSIGASASYAEQKESFKSDGNSSSVELDLIRVPIRRSWWDSTVFWDTGWKFDPNINRIVLSNGESPPAGEMTCYVSAMIIARNLKAAIDFTSENNSHVATQFSASKSVGWGPFSIRGNYSRNTDQKTHDFTRTGAGIECAGMQVIGFVCELLPKSPNPDPKLNW